MEGEEEVGGGGEEGEGEVVGWWMGGYGYREI